MTSLTADGRADCDGLLLSHLDRIEGTAADPQRKPAELADCVLNTGEETAVLLDKELRAARAASLLVARQDEDDVACRFDAFGTEAQQGCDEHRHSAFHVERAATPHLAVDELSREGRVEPLVGLCRHDIDVAVEQERWSLASSADPRHKVRPLRIACKETRF